MAAGTSSLPCFNTSVFENALSYVIDNFKDDTVKAVTKEQRDAIFSFLSGRDTFVCLPTGYGKSLIYQAALLMSKRLSKISTLSESNSGLRIPPSPMLLVVSPLNSLISDQVSSCQNVGLTACKLECQCDRQTLETDVAFVSPECLVELVSKQFLHKLIDRIIGVVVDESHCIVNW